MPLTTRGPNTRATVTIQQPHPPTGSSSQTNSLEDSDYPSESYSEYDDSHWGDDEDDVGPSDSASISNDGVAYHHVPPRRSHRVVPANHWRDQQSPAPAHPHHPPPNVDPEADYRGGWGRAYPQQHQPRHPRQQHQGYYNGGGGRGYPAGGHPNGGHVAPYNNMAAYANNGMVPFGQQQQYGGNPFGQGPGYFNGAGRGYDMMAYGGYYGDPAQYAIPASMQQYHRPPPASTPPENTSQAVTPVPKEDPEKIRLEAELAAMKAQEEKAKQAAKQAEIEAQIRKDAEEAFKRRMEDMRIAQEEARKEIERAKEEAERAVRERIEAEKKAEAERARQQAEALQRAEENARIKFEADQKAAEERRKREEEDRKRAEEAARIRLEAAIKAEEAAKAAAAQKAAEEAARIKQIEEDAKRKAEADAAAKAEKEKADAAAAAEAAEAAKKEQDRLKAMWQEEARKKAEEASKKKQEKAPIRFKDAVGRKFSFPFHLCQTWGGMEELIKQAFLQVDVLGPHVQKGHYDLTGPNGEIILPQVWDKVIEPDWSITMTMWPMPEKPPPPPGPRNPAPPPTNGHRSQKVHVPPPPGGFKRAPSGATPGIDVVNVAPHKHKSKKKDETLFKFFAGAPSKKKKGKK